MAVFRGHTAHKFHLARQFRQDTVSAWLSYREENTMPLYLPKFDEPVELHGCDPIRVSVVPTEAAMRDGWAFQIPIAIPALKD